MSDFSRTHICLFVSASPAGISYASYLRKLPDMMSRTSENPIINLLLVSTDSVYHCV